MRRTTRGLDGEERIRTGDRGIGRRDGGAGLAAGSCAGSYAGRVGRRLGSRSDGWGLRG